MKKLEEVIKVIKKGGVVVVPTDTVYGLIADATNKKAVAKIFKIKNRPKSKPLPIFVKDIKIVKELAEIDKNQEEFLKSVWPGPVTVILKRRSNKIKLYGLDRNTIAVRIPKHGLLLSIVKHIGLLAETSANVSGQPAPGNIKEILKQFAGQKYQPDLIVRHLVSNKSKPSKVIDLTKTPYKILRK